VHEEISGHEKRLEKDGERSASGMQLEEKANRIIITYISISF
jgi:hypothetical protein